jgi:hypothetical protein
VCGRGFLEVNTLIGILCRIHSQVEISSFHSMNNKIRKVLMAMLCEHTLVGCRVKKADPKQAEKVDSGSVTPRSVPATLAVYPERKWYMAWPGVRMDTGGSTP